MICSCNSWFVFSSFSVRVICVIRGLNILFLFLVRVMYGRNILFLFIFLIRVISVIRGETFFS